MEYFQWLGCTSERITIQSQGSAFLHEDILLYKVIFPWGFEGLLNSEYFTWPGYITEYFILSSAFRLFSTFSNSRHLCRLQGWPIISLKLIPKSSGTTFKSVSLKPHIVKRCFSCSIFCLHYTLQTGFYELMLLLDLRLAFKSHFHSFSTPLYMWVSSLLLYPKPSLLHFYFLCFDVNIYISPFVMLKDTCNRKKLMSTILYPILLNLVFTKYFKTLELNTYLVHTFYFKCQRGWLGLIWGLHCIQLSCWPWKSHGNPQTTPTLAKTMGCSLKSDNWAPLLRTALTELIALVPTCRLHSYHLVSFVWEDTLQAPKRET